MNVSGLFFFFELIPGVIKILRIQIVRNILTKVTSFDPISLDLGHRN